VRFARRLVAGGVDLVHGRSSHHPRPVEVSGARLILYGCGDLINDYEGVAGHHQYRADLRLLYFASLQPGTGALAALRMAPMQATKLRLDRAAAADAQWLAGAPPRARPPVAPPLRPARLCCAGPACRPGTTGDAAPGTWPAPPRRLASAPAGAADSSRDPQSPTPRRTSRSGAARKVNPAT